ncbi:hypothetical protein GCM10011360_27620 [Primorskyibacter flagellatus]|uniref:Uncharacterized protein n=1 Tax=Primorskyibacter flagellatus TaxID=1387277 RepID=A0A917EIC5_9RHOB|nr:hypothetical protein [Primorskyibacter flagellatus]GGE38292.1 hypothetical protein GCM10011360_27620 [Primorskyibacter flagellatus]
MLSLTLRATLAGDNPIFYGQIGELYPLVDPLTGTGWLFSAATATGVVTSFTLREGAGFETPRAVTVAGGGSVFRIGDMEVIDSATGPDLMIARIGADSIATFDIGSVGQLSGARTLSPPSPITEMVAVERGGTTFVISGARDGAGLQVHERSVAGTLTLRDSVADHGKIAVANTSDLIEVQSGGQRYVVTGSVQDDAISSFTVGADGSLEMVDTLGTKDGLWVWGLDGLASVRAHDVTYVAVSATNSSSLTLVRVNEMGVFFVEDHITDSLDTRFANVDAVAGFAVGDRGFLVAGGADDGLSLFEIMPDHALFSHEGLVQQSGGALEDIAALGIAHFAGEVQIIAAGTPGLTLATLPTQTIAAPRMGSAASEDLSGGNGADLIWGGAGNDTVSGGAGNDILAGGAGADRLTGGAGADVFVFSDDAPQDVVTDFELGTDRIDLSRWGRIYDVSSLLVQEKPDGAELYFRGLSLRLITDDGQRLQAEDLTNDSFLF